MKRKAAKRTRAPKAAHNPPLVVWGNPPRKPITLQVVDRLGTVDRVYYKHAEDGKRYQHPFTRTDEVLAVQIGKQRALLLVSSDGRDLWNDFQ